MIGPPPHFGQARYAYSQAAEKLLKCALSTKRISFEFTHHIDKLAKMLVADAAMPPLSSELVENASAKSAMRYGNVQVSMIEAVRAQNAALQIARHVHTFLLPELEAKRLQAKRATRG